MYKRQTLALLSNGDYLAVGENSNANIGIVAELSPTGALLSTVTPGTVVAALSSSQGGSSPTIFQPNGDYITTWTTATLHDLSLIHICYSLRCRRCWKSGGAFRRS